MSRDVRHHNNFDLLRLVAAIAVIVTHSYPITDRPEPIFDATGTTFGELGVGTFFAISGYLVTRSFIHDSRVFAFAARRALRILPGLVIAVLLTAFVLGPAVTTLSLGAYLTDVGTYEYALRNVVFLITDPLPGVFVDHPDAGVVNGSLWTLPYEVIAYGGVVVLGLVGGLGTRRGLLATVVLACLAISAIAGVPDYDADGIRQVLVHVVLLAGFFAVGMALCVFADRIPLHLAGVVILGGLWVLSWNTGWRLAVEQLFVGYGALWLALRTPPIAKRVLPWGDVSYGMYIYAYPVQQLLYRILRPDVEAWHLTLLSIAVTFVLAYASWRLIEHPALRHKPSHAARPVPSAVLSQPVT